MSPETRIYIKIGGSKYALPVNPAEIKVSHSTVDKTAEVAGVGEIVVPQKPGLREISFSSFLPGESYHPYVHGTASPRRMAKAFEKAWKKRTKCRLIISRSNGYDTNMRCVISDLSFTDKGGEVEDIYYEITLQEYRSYGVSQMTVVSTSGSSGGAVGPGANLTEANGQLSQVITATTEAVRPVETPQLVVGADVIVNGAVYSDGSGLVPVEQASNTPAKITRIVSSNAFPYRVGNMGWVAESQLQFAGGGS